MNYVIVEHKAEQQSKRVEIIHTILLHYPNVLNTPDSNGNYLFEHIMNIIPSILEQQSSKEKEKNT